MIAWRAFPVLLPLSILGACGPGGTPQQAPAEVKKENPAHQQLLAASEVDRKLALRRAVQDDGGSCPRIDSSTYQQDYKGMAMWVAHCSRGDWAVFVAPSGIIQARACKDAKAVGLPECKPAADQPKPLEPLWSAESNPMPPPTLNEVQ